MRIVLLLMVLFALPAYAGTAVREVDYSASRPLEVRTALGVTTVIELDPSEEVLDYSIGFAQGWEVTRRDSVFYLKPRDVDVGTNMLIRTRARQYMLELQVVAGDWTSLSQGSNAGVAYRVVIHAPKVAADVVEAKPVVESNEFFGYSMRAERIVSSVNLPILIFDDGDKTTIRFSSSGARTQAVVAARMSLSEEPFLVNRTVAGNDIVVEGVFPFLQLRVGQGRVDIRRNAQ